MPKTETMIPVFASIGQDSRVVHNRYGRGKVKRLILDDGHAYVEFDDDKDFGPRRVRIKDMTREPADMPAAVLDDRAQLSPTGVA